MVRSWVTMITYWLCMSPRESPHEFLASLRYIAVRFAALSIYTRDHWILGIKNSGYLNAAKSLVMTGWPWVPAWDFAARARPTSKIPMHRNPYQNKKINYHRFARISDERSQTLRRTTSCACFVSQRQVSSS